MGGAERARHADAEREHVGDRHDADTELVGQAFAGEPFHRQPGVAGQRVAVRDVADDSGVAQLAEDARLEKEAGHGDVVGLAQKLYGDGLAAKAIGGAVNHAHSARSDHLLDRKAIGH